MNAKIGDNNPPSEFELVRDEINDLYDEAKNWADGEAITSDAIAENVETLINQIKAAKKLADELRKEEVKPHDELKKAIQEKYNPLIADTKGVTGKTVLALNVLKKLLTPWKQKQQDLKDEEVRKATELVAQKEREAQKAMQADSLEEREKAQELMAEAQKATKSAKRASKDTVKGMRTTYKVQMVHPKIAFTHYWNGQRQEILDLIQAMAEREVCEAVQKIPGFKITKEKVAK